MLADRDVELAVDVRGQPGCDVRGIIGPPDIAADDEAPRARLDHGVTSVLMASAPNSGTRVNPGQVQWSGHHDHSPERQAMIATDRNRVDVAAHVASALFTRQLTTRSGFWYADAR